MYTRDLRKYSRQTTIRLVVGVIIILFVVGESLIYVIYGLPAAATGFLCLIGGLSPIVLIIGLLWLIDLIVKRSQQS